MSFDEFHFRPAKLMLADGTVYNGSAFGAETVRAGEVVFNTSMTGYQEICTDPSYAGQLVVMTYTQIGNVGVNPDDEESDSADAGRVRGQGVVPASEQLAFAGRSGRIFERREGSWVGCRSTPGRW